MKKYAEPFDHWEGKASDYVPLELLEKVLEEFPDLRKHSARAYSNYNEKKRASTELMPNAKKLVNYLNSPEFCSILSEITGIPDLLPDNELTGGGYHEIHRGGKLGVHIDFNRKPELGYRRLNLIVYLNKDWKDEYRGHLQLCGQDRVCVKRILPAFDTLAIFATSEISWHGHPEPLECPDDMSRKSIALYYYTEKDPAFATKSHDTVFAE
jgi:Rps23 Pro-64 3,4-dihydroxylase Tpa1-like proline 4-hydroxylase